VPTLNYFRTKRRESGAQRTDYNFLGCVGHAINMFSKNKFNIEISSLAMPQSMSDIKKYERATPLKISENNTSAG